MNTQTESPTRLPGRWRLNARLGWLLFTLTCILLTLSIVFLVLSWGTPVPDTWGFRGDAMLLALAYGGIGLLLTRRHPQNLIGWLLLLASLINSILEFCVEYATYVVLTKPGGLPYGILAAWIASWLWVIGIAILLYVFLLFPTGHLPSARWRPITWFFVGAFGLQASVFMIQPGPLYFAPYLDNPFAVQIAYRVLRPTPVATAAAVLLVGISVILRLRRAEGVERQQLKWFAYAATLRAIFGISESVAEAVSLRDTVPKIFDYLSVALWIAIAVAIAFAILRYRLWDIDIIINRTLVYFTLTAVVAGLYVLIVGAVSGLLQNQNDLAAPAIALLIIATFVRPLGRALQNNVNRLLHFDPGRRNDSQHSLPESLEKPDEAQAGNVQVRVITQVDSSSPTRLHGRWLLIARLAWVIIFLTLTAMYAFGFLAVHETLSTVCEDELCTLRQQIRRTDAGEQVVDWPGPPIGYADRLRSEQVKALETLGPTLDEYSWLGALQMGIPVLAHLMIAAGLFWRKSDNWIVLFVSMMVATFSLQDMPLSFTLVVQQPAWESVFTPATAGALSSFLIFPLIFPTGRFVPRWTRWTALFVLAGAFILTLFQNSILQIPGAENVVVVYLLISFGTGVYAQLYRYFRVASPVERQQLKWVIVGLVGFVGTTFAVLQPLEALPSTPIVSADPARALVLSAILDTLFRVLSLFIPVSIAISVLRYRLWDIDIIINRTLVYGALTASVVALYVLIVGGLSIGLQTPNILPGIIISILVVAFLFRPLRQRLQGIADRFVPVPQSAPPVEQHKYQTTTPTEQGAVDTRLRGRWLLIARLTWVAVFVALTLMYVFGFLAVHEGLSTICEAEPCTLTEQIQSTDAGEKVVGWAGPPLGFADRLRPHQIEALATLGLTPDQYGWLGALQMGLPALVFLLIAAGLFWWKSHDWMVLFSSIVVATFPSGPMPLPFILGARQPAWQWVLDAANLVAVIFFLIFPLIFPNGRFVPRWARWKVLFDIAFAIITILFRNSIAGNPVAGYLIFSYVLISMCTGVYAQVYRYFRVASPVERQQLKWVVVGLAVWVFTAFALLPLDALLISRAASMDPARALLLPVIPDTIFQVTLLFIPISIAISVLRYRLWDIDIIINRTLVYGALTGIIVGAFVIMVGLLSVVFQSSGNSIIAVVATGLVALLFNPLRQRLQRGINHLMYGERDDPYAALSRLGRRLETTLAPEAVLPTVVTTVRDVLRLPYVAIYLQQDSHGYKIVAESASPSLRSENGRIIVPGMNREGLCIPLIHQGETLGYIVLGPRAPNEAFSTTDLRLLDDLAPQVGVAVHAVRLTADLQRSREQLVLAREEERRRLRRDLHDDLAPTLASLGLTASTAADLISTNPTKATALVKELQTEIRATVGNIRHLVYDLRPPTLDELGLLAAVRERATQYSNAPDGFQVIVNAPAELAALPAAIEVAAYRIVQEALENISKHAQAQKCSIRLTNHNGLEIEIADDGIGLPSNITPGVGLRSMRERAEELGGSCVIKRGVNGGTRVLAQLPVGDSNGSVKRIDRG